MSTVVDVPTWFVPAFDLGFAAVMLVALAAAIWNTVSWSLDLRALRHPASHEHLDDKAWLAVRTQRRGDLAMEIMTILGVAALFMVGVAGASERRAHDYHVTLGALIANLLLVFFLGLLGTKSIVRRIVRRRVERILRVDTSIR